MAISALSVQPNSPNIDNNMIYGSKNLGNKSYRSIVKWELDIPEIHTSIASPLPVYPLSPEILYELLKEGAVYVNIDLIENLPSEELEEEVEISEDLKEFENDMLKDNIILNEEESELFIQELNSLHYDDKTLEFYKSSTQILKKIKNGEFIIDL